MNCSCGHTLPALETCTFLFRSGKTKAYQLGQCGRCHTIFWERRKAVVTRSAGGPRIRDEPHLRAAASLRAATVGERPSSNRSLTVAARSSGRISRRFFPHRQPLPRLPPLPRPFPIPPREFPCDRAGRRTIRLSVTAAARPALDRASTSPRSPVMALVGQILSWVGGLGVLVCFIWVLVQMFTHGKTGLAILFIVLSCCGIGVLITFIYGWIKSREWNISNVMLVWTLSWIIGVIGGIMAPPDYQAIQNQIQQQQQQMSRLRRAGRSAARPQFFRSRLYLPPSRCAMVAQSPGRAGGCGDGARFSPRRPRPRESHDDHDAGGPGPPGPGLPPRLATAGPPLLPRQPDRRRPGPRPPGQPRPAPAARPVQHWPPPAWASSPWPWPPRPPYRLLTAARRRPPHRAPACAPPWTSCRTTTASCRTSSTPPPAPSTARTPAARSNRLAGRRWPCGRPLPRATPCCESLADRLYDRIDWRYWTAPAAGVLLRHGKGGRRPVPALLLGPAQRRDGVHVRAGRRGRRGPAPGRRRAGGAAAVPRRGRRVALQQRRPGAVRLPVRPRPARPATLACAGGPDLCGRGRPARRANEARLPGAADRFATYRRFWGLSAGDGPGDRRSADAYRAYAPAGPLDGTAHLTATLASVAHHPGAVLENLCQADARWALPADGRYGFSNVNLDRGWVGRDMVGIDAGAAVLALDNFLAADRVRAGFHNAPRVAAGCERLGFTCRVAPERLASVKRRTSPFSRDRRGAQVGDASLPVAAKRYNDDTAARTSPRRAMPQHSSDRRAGRPLS